MGKPAKDRFEVKFRLKQKVFPSTLNENVVVASQAHQPLDRNVDENFRARSRQVSVEAFVFGVLPDCLPSGNVSRPLGYQRCEEKREVLCALALTGVGLITGNNQILQDDDKIRKEV